jgi:lactate racemase
MKIELPWSNGKLTLEVPDTWHLHFPTRQSGDIKIPRDELEPVRAALKKPINSKPLQALKLKDKKVLIVVDDISRPTPVHKFMHIILEELKKAGVPTKRITVIPALGIHAKMNEKEMKEKIGAKNLRGLKWENHDAFNLNRLHTFGYTSRGTPVILNHQIKYTDMIITIGMIEPHLWAGFGGGMKNIFPGLAAANSISIHHSVIAEPPYHYNRVGLDPRQNPFRLDLEEVKGFISIPIFCVNVIIDSNRRIIDAVAGDPIAAHREGVEINKKLSGLFLEKKMDGIIVNSFPMDINLKQSAKGVGNSLPALKPGGVIMGFLRAERGIDEISLPKNSKPLWLVKRLLRILGPSKIMWLLEKTRKGLNVEEQFLTYYSMQLVREFELYFHVPTLSDQQVRLLSFFNNFRNPQEVIDRALKKLGKEADVAVFAEAGATFPIIR